MYFQITYKNVKDQMKMKALDRSQHYAAIFKTFKGSLLCSWWSGVSFKLLRLSSLPARMRKIHSKMQAQEWSQRISKCKYMEILTDAQGQLTPQSEVGSA